MTENYTPAVGHKVKWTFRDRNGWVTVRGEITKIGGSDEFWVRTGNYNGGWASASNLTKI